MSISTESAVEVVVVVEVEVVADDAVSMGADSAREGNEAWLLATVSGPGGLEDPLLLDPSPLVDVAAAEGGARLLALPYIKKKTHARQPKHVIIILPSHLPSFGD